MSHASRDVTNSPEKPDNTLFVSSFWLEKPAATPRLVLPDTWFTLCSEDMVYTFPEGMVSTCSANGLSMGSTLHPSSSK